MKNNINLGIHRRYGRDPAEPLCHDIENNKIEYAIFDQNERAYAFFISPIIDLLPDTAVCLCTSYETKFCSVCINKFYDKDQPYPFSTRCGREFTSRFLSEESIFFYEPEYLRFFLVVDDYCESGMEDLFQNICNGICDSIKKINDYVQFCIDRGIPISLDKNYGGECLNAR